jgi:hypothetical protein
VEEIRTQKTKKNTGGSGKRKKNNGLKKNKSTKIESEPGSAHKIETRMGN